MIEIYWICIKQISFDKSQKTFIIVLLIRLVWEERKNLGEK